MFSLECTSNLLTQLQYGMPNFRIHYTKVIGIMKPLHHQSKVETMSKTIWFYDITPGTKVGI